MPKRDRYSGTRAFVTTEPMRRAPPGWRARPIGAAAGVIEHTVIVGDRLDMLAFHYYADPRLWWRIVDANPELFYGGDAVLVEDEATPDGLVLRASMIGRILRIPRAREVR